MGAWDNRHKAMSEWRRAQIKNNDTRVATQIAISNANSFHRALTDYRMSKDCDPEFERALLKFDAWLAKGKNTL